MKLKAILIIIVGFIVAAITFLTVNRMLIGYVLSFGLFIFTTIVVLKKAAAKKKQQW